MDNDEDVRTFFVQENHGDAKVRWNGVVDVGRDCKCDEPDWKLVVGGVEIILRPGFTVTREVQTRAHGYVTVICKILERELSSRTIPLYECTADIGHGRRITTSSIVCRAAVRDILERVGAVTKHKWAQDFFGLSKSSVSTLLATPRHEDEPSNKRPRSAVRRVAPILVRLQNIRNRGSGPTSQLQRNEDRGRRNSVINKAVSFASFNDVKSVYLVSGMHVPDLFGFHSWLGRGSSYFADGVEVSRVLFCFACIEWN